MITDEASSGWSSFLSNFCIFFPIKKFKVSSLVFLNFRYWISRVCLMCSEHYGVVYAREQLQEFRSKTTTHSCAHEKSSRHEDNFPRWLGLLLWLGRRSFKASSSSSSSVQKCIINIFSSHGASPLNRKQLPLE